MRRVIEYTEELTAHQSLSKPVEDQNFLSVVFVEFEWSIEKESHSGEFLDHSVNQDSEDLCEFRRFKSRS